MRKVIYMNMKRSLVPSIVGAALLLITLPSGGIAQGKFGAGLTFGEPSGIAWKYRISQTNAVEGAIGFSPYDQYRIHADYIWQSNPFHEQRLALHYGVGAVLGFGRTQYSTVNGRTNYFFRNQDVGFAARVPLGLSYAIPQSPVDLFLEAAPLMIFTPTTGVGLDAALGVRFYP